MIRPLNAADHYRAIYKSLFKMHERHWRWSVVNFANDNSGWAA